MNARKLLTLAVAATVLVGGLAAAGAATPTDAQASENAPDDPSENANDDADDADDSSDDADERDDADENASDADENASDVEAADAADAADGDAADGNQSEGAAAGDQGPPSDMPAPVPDHVSQIHEEINSFLDGEIDNLGHALSDLLGNDGDSGDAEDVEDAEGNQTTTDENASAVAPLA